MYHRMASPDSFIPFPSIQHLRHLADTLAHFPDAPPDLRYLGTVKLHGTNMGVSQARAGAPVIAQSRNRLLSLEHDNRGTAEFVHERTDAFLRLFSAVRARAGAAPDAPVMLFGELAGRKVQSGVGISEAEKFCALFCVKVGDRYEDLEWYADVLRDEPSRIFNVLQFGRYEAVVRTADPLASEARLQELAEAVGRDCPAARFLGHPGRGEGIVWTCADVASERVWFKSKSAAYCAAVNAPKPPPPDTAELAKLAWDFAVTHVTEARLLQGLDHLVESERAPDRPESIGPFVKWVVEDTLKEEGGALTAAQARACRKEVASMAAAWFRCRTPA